VSVSEQGDPVIDEPTLIPIHTALWSEEELGGLAQRALKLREAAAAHAAAVRKFDAVEAELKGSNAALVTAQQQYDVFVQKLAKVES